MKNTIEAKAIITNETFKTDEKFVGYASIKIEVGDLTFSVSIPEHHTNDKRLFNQMLRKRGFTIGEIKSDCE